MPRCRVACIGVLVACACAALVRVPQLNESLWLDELHTDWCAGGAWREVAERARIGNQSPTYFYLSRLAVLAFGRSEWSLRLPSAAAGMLLVPAVAAVVLRWTSSAGAASMAALLVALDPNMVFYAQEARPYAWVQLTAWAHLAVTSQLPHRPTLVLRAGFVAIGTLLFHLHYTAALFLIGEVAYLVFTACRPPPSRAPYRGGKLASDLVLLGLACLPAASHLLAIGRSRMAWQAVVSHPSWWGLVQAFRLDVYLFVPLAAVALGLLAFRIRRAALWPVSGSGAAPAPSADSTECVRDVSHRRPSPTDSRHSLNWMATYDSLLICVLVIPAALAWLATNWDIAPLFFRRYLVASLAPAIALSAAMTWALPLRSLRCAVAAAVVVASLTASGMIPQFVHDGRWISDRRQDWRGAVGLINQQRRGDDEAALVRSGYLEGDRLREPHLELLEQYCLAPVSGIYSLAMPTVPLPTSRAADFEAQTWQRLPPLNGAWFLFNGRRSHRESFEAAVIEQLSRLPARFHVAQRHEFGDILVLEMRRRPHPKGPGGE